MHLIATTDEHGLHIDCEQLERTGIEPGSRALVEIRHCTEEDWMAGERTIRKRRGDARPLWACPSHADEYACPIRRL